MIFCDESGFLLQPLRRRCWAPVGATPVQRPSQRHDRLSVMCALSVSPHLTRYGLHYEILNHNCSASDFERFLRRIHHNLGHDVLLIWDRLSGHRSAAKHLRESGCSWLHPHWLPGYAPELDPVEYIWTQAKYGDLANWIPQDIDEVREQLTGLLETYRDDQVRLHSFFDNAKLSWD